MKSVLLVLGCLLAVGCSRRLPPVVTDPIGPPVIVDPSIPLPPSEIALALPDLLRALPQYAGKTVFLRGVTRMVQEPPIPGGYRLEGGGVSLNAAESAKARELFLQMPRLLGVEITVVPHHISGNLPPQWVEVIDFRQEGSFQQTLSVAQLARQLAAYEGRTVTVTGGFEMDTDYWPIRHFLLLDQQGHAVPLYQDDQSERLFNYFKTGAIHGVDVTGILQQGRLVIQRYRTYRS